MRVSERLPPLLVVVGVEGGTAEVCHELALVVEAGLARELDAVEEVLLEGSSEMVKPGITGLAQVEGRNELTWDEKLTLDVRYVESQSFWMDARIILKTPLVVLSSSGFRRSGEATKFGE